MNAGERRYGTAICFLAICLVSWGVLLFLYNLLPGHAPFAAASIADISFARCIDHSPGAFDFSCHNSGYPYGAPSTFGLPLDVAMAFALKFGLSSLTALRLTYGLLLSVALAGCIRFLGNFSENKWVHLLGALLYMASPIVVFEDGYGPLRLGFALVPAYVYVHILAIRHFSNLKNFSWHTTLWLAALIGTNTFALFCDGYSFVMSLVLGGLFWAQWLLKEIKGKKLSKAMLGSAAALSSVALSVLLYKLYIPEAAYSPMPLAFFRGQGVDLYFMAVPSDATWFAKITGWHHHFTAAQAYSDGPNASLVYLGYSLLACALLYAYLAVKGKVNGWERFIPLAIASLVALALSIGPALKIHDIRVDAPSGISMDTYLMPEGKATLELGTGWIYEHLPGIDIMRALYRWQLLVRLGLIAAAMSALAALLQRKRYVAAALLTIILIADTFPPIDTLRARGASNNETLTRLDAELVTDVRTHLHQNSRVVFLQLHPNASGNQFLASYICAEANLSCYNVGGDKATELASEYWPAPVFEIIAGVNPSLNVREVFEAGLADVVAVPFFDMRMQAYSWPPKGFPRDQVMALIKRDYSSYSVQMTPWFALIRPGTNPPAKAAAMSTGQVADIENWGPRSFNSRTRAKTYLWIKTQDPPTAASVAIDGHILATAPNGTGVIAAPLRAADRVILDKPGRHAVYLIDREQRHRQLLGDITINE